MKYLRVFLLVFFLHSSLVVNVYAQNKSPILDITTDVLSLKNEQPSFRINYFATQKLSINLQLKFFKDSSRTNNKSFHDIKGNGLVLGLRNFFEPPHHIHFKERITSSPNISCVVFPDKRDNLFKKLLKGFYWGIGVQAERHLQKTTIKYLGVNEKFHHEILVVGGKLNVGYVIRIGKTSFELEYGLDSKKSKVLNGRFKEILQNALISNATFGGLVHSSYLEISIGINI